jgi:hypothetical protein
MNHEFVSAIIVAVLTSSGLWGVLQVWLTHKQKQAQDEKDATAKETESRRAKEARDSQTWYRESRNHYDVAKREAAEAREEAKACRKEVEHTRQIVYLLLEELEDQIIPLLSTPDAVDPIEIRSATRAAIKTARESLRASAS